MIFLTASFCRAAVDFSGLSDERSEEFRHVGNSLAEQLEISCFCGWRKKAPYGCRPARNGRREAVWGAIPVAQGRMGHKQQISYFNTSVLIYPVSPLNLTFVQPSACFIRISTSSPEYPTPSLSAVSLADLRTLTVVVRR